MYKVGHMLCIHALLLRGLCRLDLLLYSTASSRGHVMELVGIRCGYSVCSLLPLDHLLCRLQEFFRPIRPFRGQALGLVDVQCGYSLCRFLTFDHQMCRLAKLHWSMCLACRGQALGLVESIQSFRIQASTSVFPDLHLYRLVRYVLSIRCRIQHSRQDMGCILDSCPRRHMVGGLGLVVFLRGGRSHLFGKFGIQVRW